jgi:hypothetical protein
MNKIFSIKKTSDQTKNSFLTTTNNNMSTVLEKLKKNCRIKEADVLSESEFYAEKDITSTSVPMINVALSGSIDGGLTSGLTILAGPSKHFKCVGPNTPIYIYIKE